MAEGKGMSKGCTVALIVVGVILVLVIALAVTCYFYWGDAVKMSANALVGEAKTVLAQDPPEGVDTVQFNALADAFVERFDPENLRPDEYGPMLSQFGEAIKDKRLTADEVQQMSDAMVLLYPDLQRYVAPVEEIPLESDMLDEVDTTDADL